MTMTLSNLEEVVRLRNRRHDLCKQINDIADCLAMRGRFHCKNFHVSLTLNLAGEHVTVSENFDIEHALNAVLISLRRSRTECDARLLELGVEYE